MSNQPAAICLAAAIFLSGCAEPARVCASADTQGAIANMLIRHAQSAAETLTALGVPAEAIPRRFTRARELNPIRFENVALEELDKDTGRIKCVGTIWVGNPKVKKPQTNADYSWQSSPIRFERIRAADGKDFLYKYWLPDETALDAISYWSLNKALDGEMERSAETPPTAPPQLAAPSSAPDQVSGTETVPGQFGKPTMVTGITTGMSYKEARPILITQGLVPVPHPSGPDDCGTHGFCRSYPEVFLCTAPEVGWCYGGFMYRGRFVVVDIPVSNDPSDEPYVDAVRYSSSEQDMIER